MAGNAASRGARLAGSAGGGGGGHNSFGNPCWIRRYHMCCAQHATQLVVGEFRSRQVEAQLHSLLTALAALYVES